ncbi:hypothetical protein [Croceimicrobium sp.]|uniref:hypothetical protein n=1 Tax=Croceimicrobium sp. TaxID=2828340 RepID=UPI003BA94E7D
MKRTKLYLVVLIGFVVGPSLSAQNILGLWQVTNVQVGDKEMTPQEKWIRFSEQGFEGGNGLLQNGAGTYLWKAQEMKLSMNDSLGFVDPFDAFKVEVTDSSMQWSRQEEGMEVTVHLKRIQSLPLRMADKVVGVWQAESEDSLAYVFFRWDKVYTIVYKDGSRESGLWYAHAHRLELSLHPWDKNERSRHFKILAGPWKTLHLEPADRTGIDWIFSRRRTFPD